MPVPHEPPAGPAQIRLVSPMGSDILSYGDDGTWYGELGWSVFLDPGLKWVAVADIEYGINDTNDTPIGNYTNDLYVEAV